jgi:ATP-dependent helicase HepA
MICSEIGSEGRNFQFARHLVMFDLPLNPELLEQRIGRLDRIGQTSNISIHIPYVKMSAWEIIVKWYKDGLEIFKNNVNGVHHIFKKFGERVTDLAMERIKGEEVPESVLAALLKETGDYRRDLARQLEKGRDRLLELNSFHAGKAKKLTGEIESIDHSRDIDNFMLRIFHHYGIQADESGGRTYRLHFNNAPGPEFPVPALRENPMAVTFDRKTALCREDIDFLSWDNPMVTGSMELLLGTQQGNSSLALWKGSDTEGILLEAFFVLECIAPSTLHIDRFLPTEPVRVVVDHLGRDVTIDYPLGQFEKSLENLPGSWLSKNPEISGVLLPKMINNTCDIAKKAAFGIMESGVSDIESSIGREIRRLKELRKVNPGIRAKEIELMVLEMEELRKHMLTARFRLDALRAVVML